MLATVLYAVLAHAIMSARIDLYRSDGKAIGPFDKARITSIIPDKKPGVTIAGEYQGPGMLSVKITLDYPQPHPCEYNKNEIAKKAQDFLKYLKENGFEAGLVETSGDVKADLLPRTLKDYSRK